MQDLPLLSKMQSLTLDVSSTTGAWQISHQSMLEFLGPNSAAHYTPFSALHATVFCYQCATTSATLFCNMCTATLYLRGDMARLIRAVLALVHPHPGSRKPAVTYFPRPARPPWSTATCLPCACVHGDIAVLVLAAHPLQSTSIICYNVLPLACAAS